MARHVSTVGRTRLVGGVRSGGLGSPVTVTFIFSAWTMDVILSYAINYLCLYPTIPIVAYAYKTFTLVYKVYSYNRINIKPN